MTYRKLWCSGSNRTAAMVGALASAALTLVACGSSSSTPAATGTDYGLITPGQVTVAISTGNMPYNGLKDGRQADRA